MSYFHARNTAPERSGGERDRKSACAFERVKRSSGFDHRKRLAFAFPLPFAFAFAAMALFVSLLVGTRAANAQQPLQPPPPPPASGAAVVPPRLKTDSPARYPEQALRDHVREKITVQLVLEIDANGTVKNATIETPAGHGFDEAAASAASSLVFDPATKSGAPVAAKIRYSYTFEPPAARVVGKILRQPNEAPIEGATIVVRSAAQPNAAAPFAERTTTSAADGTFRVENLPAGKVRVHVSARGRKDEDADVDLEPGDEAQVVLRLSPVDAPPPPVTAEGPVEEVRVKGERPPREVTKHSIPREEIAVIPGTNGDALRSLQNLPGVARPPPFGGQLVVRGSAPQDTNYFVDGTNIPLIYHFGGLSSVVPTEVLDRIDFYPGNYGAQYGRGMGGVVDVAARGPKNDGKLHAMAQVDFIDARVLVERSIGSGWSFLVAGRRSYFDLWLGPILEASAGVSTAPRYYDWQVMLKKELGPDHDLRFLFFGSDDRLEIFGSTGGDFALGGGIRAKVAFWRIQARYQYRISAKTRFTAVTAIGNDTIEFGFGSSFADYTTTPISARGEISHRFAKQVTANVGIDILDNPYNLKLRFPRPSRPGSPDAGFNQPQLTQNISNSVYTPAAYAELELTPFKGSRIIPGVRADYTKEIKHWDVAPRIVVRQDISNGKPRTTLKGGVGIYYQPPFFLEVDPVFGTPNLKTNRSVHYSAGMEQELGSHVQVSVEGFYKALDRLVVQDLGNTGDGRVFGAEWLIRWQNDPKMFGWLAYTLMRSERRETEQERLSLFQYDQTHILTAILSRDLGKGWRLGGRFRLVSGNLYTSQHYGALDVDRASYLPVSASPQFDARLGAFHQLDVRLDKVWTTRLVKITGYIDIQNIYFHRSPEGVGYNYNYTQSQPVQGLPILPIIGVRGDL
jgi:TonB family protein